MGHRTELRDITQTLRELADAVVNDNRSPKALLPRTLRDAAEVIDEQDREIVRLQSLVDEYERPRA